MGVTHCFLILKIMYKKINRIIIGGVLSTVISYITFPIIYRNIFQEEFFILSYLTACIINITFSYTIQRIFVYKSKEKLLREFIFFSNAIILIIITYINLYILINWLNINYFQSNCIAVTISAIISFVLHYKRALINVR